MKKLKKKIQLNWTLYGLTGFLDTFDYFGETLQTRIFICFNSNKIL